MSEPEKRQKAHPNLRRGTPKKDSGAVERDEVALPKPGAKKAQRKARGAQSEGIPPGPKVSNVKNNVMPTQPGRNGGTLNARGTYGNKSGPGRPKTDLRKASSETYEQLQRRLKKMAAALGKQFDIEASKTSPNVDLMSRTAACMRGICDVMGKYGPGTRVVNVLERPEWIEMSYQGVVECFPGLKEQHVRYADWLGEKIGTS